MSAVNIPAPSSRIRVVHVITGLMVGGAEIMLWRLLSALGPSVENEVISLSPEGPVAEKIRALGVPVHSLNLKPGPTALAGLPALIRELKARAPDMVHTWMYHADFLGGIAAKLLGIPVVWALHNSALDPVRTRRSMRWMVRALAGLSRWVPAAIISCSEFGKRVHAELGYESKTFEVIPNGFDTDVFKPSTDYRMQARATWHCGETDIVVGHVARFHSDKDHATLLRAAGLALAQEPRLLFVMYGAGVTPANRSLTQWAKDAGVEARCLMLGPDATIEQRLPGFDLLVSSSRNEAFPLVLGEAMASGVPCVATNAGDSAAILNDPARITPVAAPERLAAAIVRAVRLDEAQRTAEVQSSLIRVRNTLALAQVAKRYRDLYFGVVTP